MSVCYPLMTHISRVCLIFTVVAMVAATEPSGPEGGIEKGAEGGGVQLRRELGLWSAVSLIVGVMIGQCKNLMSTSIWCLSFATESVTIYLSKWLRLRFIMVIGLVQFVSHAATNTLTLNACGLFKCRLIKWSLSVGACFARRHCQGPTLLLRIRVTTLYCAVRRQFRV
jgi:hypothetical protein